MDLVIATGNKGKLAEIQELLLPLNFNCQAQSELNIESAEETGLTFIENAILKARHAAKLSGKPALADDSGLVVPALKGAPGIYSARYAGENATDQQRYEKLLQEMKAFSGDDRQAYFVCALAYLQHAEDPAPVIAQGLWHGKLLTAPRGENGFGYDPIMYIPGLNQGVAEMAAELKNRHSHRSKAIQLFFKQILPHSSESTL